MSTPALPPNEDDLFRAEMEADNVKPLPSRPRAELAKPRPRPIALKRMEDDAAIPGELLKDTSGWDADIENGDLITFLRPGLPSEIMRKLRRGQWIIQSTLDLHGVTSDAARIELGQFLAHARHAGLRCVCIVHGKGYRSPNSTPVLRNKVRLSLSQRNEVLAFCDARPADGGSGAVVVLLKAS
ncbi:MAG: Smr/MutS family protein [Betaproteobacteria bacterium]